ncbi:MAG: hypothetical protein QF573_02040 [Chloroflexota bacterium]|nr:hypothetical protein [Chloroflexota bacterium]MDP6507814.1 hypothetical protein [Chloroflexota bacterium]
MDGGGFDSILDDGSADAVAESVAGAGADGITVAWPGRQIGRNEGVQVQILLAGAVVVGVGLAL